MADRREYLPRIDLPDRRLGRHVNHDPESLRYLVAPPYAAVTPKSVAWERHVPSFDQGNLGSCHDADTEVLTSTGWLAFPDLTMDHQLATVDPVTRSLTYERPTRIIDLPYDGDVHVVSNQRHDFVVTPEHKMLVRKWDERARTLSPDFSFIPMKDVGWYTGLLTNVSWAGTDQSNTYTIPGVPGYKRAAQRDDLVLPMHTWLYFLGMYLAEGTMLPGTKIQIAASKKREKDFVRQLLTDMGVRTCELSDRFTFNSVRVYRHLEDLGLKGLYAAEKFVPSFVFDLPGEYIKCLLEGHRQGDGAFQDGVWTHYTSSPRLADDIQRLIFLSGGQTGMSSRKARTSTTRDGRVITGRYAELAVRHLTRSSGCIERAKDVRIEQYTGRVYCAEVPTHHTLVTRRDGKILVSGNCTINAGLGILATDPYWDTLPAEFQTHLASTDIQISLVQPLYREETRLDPFSGAWEPNDTGSDGLSSAKTLKNHGWISGYLHATSLAACHEAIQQGPFMIGILWYQNMFYPDTGGVVTPGGAIAGGHEIECNEYDLTRDLWWFVNSWTPDWGKNGRFALTSATLQSLLSQQGDATSLVPITAPAPTPIDPPQPPPPSTDPLADFPYTTLDAWKDSQKFSWTRIQKNAAAAYSTWREAHR